MNKSTKEALNKSHQEDQEEEEMATNIADMTNEEILRQQLELLAERSKTCEDTNLSNISDTMRNIAAYLDSSFEQIS